MFAKGFSSWPTCFIIQSLHPRLRKSLLFTGSPTSVGRYDADAILLKNLLGAETARMNKKGALEAMRTETITTKAPSTWSQAVTKFENGKNRLLLSAELALYIVQNMFLSVIGRVYNKDSRYEAP